MNAHDLWNEFQTPQVSLKQPRAPDQDFPIFFSNYFLSTHRAPVKSGLCSGRNWNFCLQIFAASVPLTWNACKPDFLSKENHAVVVFPEVLPDPLEEPLSMPTALHTSLLEQKPHTILEVPLFPLILFPEDEVDSLKTEKIFYSSLHSMHIIEVEKTLHWMELNQDKIGGQ